jgi:hypothetical protein
VSVLVKKKLDLMFVMSVNCRSPCMKKEGWGRKNEKGGEGRPKRSSRVG